MPKKSAGLLLFRRRDTGVEVLLIHPGGPFFAAKDAGAWSIPKGEPDEGEDPLSAAQREFAEETGCPLRGDVYYPLPEIKQKSGKPVVSWAVQGDCDADAIRSNTFTLEWPPKSGRMQEFPEADRAAWFTIDDAKEKINPAQRPLLDALIELT